MNVWCGIGRLGADPELRYSQTGNPWAIFRIAVDDWNGQEKVTHWLSVKTFGKQAEAVAEHCHKGSQVGVAGKITVRTWEDQAGQTRYVTEIVAHRVDFLSAGSQRSDASESQPRQGSIHPQGQQGQSRRENQNRNPIGNQLEPPPFDDAPPPDDSGIPF